MTIKGGGHIDRLEVWAVHQATPQGIKVHGAQTVEQVQRGTDRAVTNDRRKAHMRLGELIPVTGDMRAQGEVMWAKGDSDCRDAPNTEPLTRCDDTQAGHSRDATAMATAFEPLNRSLRTLSRTNERSEKSRRVFKKPRCYKDESDGCIDTWIEVMKLHFEEEDLSERQECSALTINLEGTALNCVMDKKQYQLDTIEKIFESLLNLFGSGVQGHQTMMRFEKRSQREDETTDKFLDDLEMLRRRNQPDESNRRMNMAVASNFIDGVRNDDFRTMLATHYTPLSTNAPTPEELRLKSKEYFR